MAGSYVPVPALPVQGPQLSLLASSIGVSTVDDGTYVLPDDVLKELPLEVQQELDNRQGAPWTRGFAYKPENFSNASVLSPFDGTTVDNPLLPVNLPIVYFQPYIISTKYSVSSFGFEDIDYKGNAVRQNALAAPFAMGREFCDGAVAQAAGWPNNYLSNAANVTVLNPTPGTAVSLTKGFELVQDYLSNTGLGGQGMIHLIPAAIPSLLVVRRVGKLMLDLLDNIVVPDPGYTGNAPGGTAPASGQTWIYATDVVATRIEPNCIVTPDTYAEALDRGEGGNPNLVTFRAQRYAAAFFDGARQAGVLVNLPS